MPMVGVPARLRAALSAASLEDKVEAGLAWLDAEGVAEWDEVVENLDDLAAALGLKRLELKRLGKHLDDSSTSAESTPEEPVAVVVKCSDGRTARVVATTGWRVRQLQERLQAELGVHAACQRLLFAGRRLDPELLLRDAEVADGTTLFCVVLADSFPQKLGPFATARVVFTERDFQLPPRSEEFATAGTMWVMDAGALARHQASTTAELPLVGQFSPSHPVTLTRAEKAAACIPETADEFCWSYPVADWGQLRGEDAVKSFLSVGGFVYFARGKVVGATTLVPAEQGGLQFGPARPWRPSWTAALMKLGRVQPITIQPLRDTGARHFCWLRPGERFPGEEQPEVEHGGFAYFFHEDVYSTDERACALDRYFPIRSGAEYEMPEQLQAPRAFFNLVSDLAELDMLRAEVATARPSVAPAELARLQVEIGRLEGQLSAATLCTVCADREKDTIFNCGHVCTCSRCAGSLQTCPLCRTAITERRRALAG